MMGRNLENIFTPVNKKKSLKEDMSADEFEKRLLSLDDDEKKKEDKEENEEEDRSQDDDHSEANTSLSKLTFEKLTRERDEANREEWKASLKEHSEKLTEILNHKFNQILEEKLTEMKKDIEKESSKNKTYMEKVMLEQFSKLEAIMKTVSFKENETEEEKKIEEEKEDKTTKNTKEEEKKETKEEEKKETKNEQEDEKKPFKVVNKVIDESKFKEKEDDKITVEELSKMNGKALMDFMQKRHKIFLNKIEMFKCTQEERKKALNIILEAKGFPKDEKMKTMLFQLLKHTARYARKIFYTDNYLKSFANYIDKLNDMITKIPDLLTKYDKEKEQEKANYEKVKEEISKIRKEGSTKWPSKQAFNMKLNSLDADMTTHQKKMKTLKDNIQSANKLIEEFNNFQSLGNDIRTMMIFLVQYEELEPEVIHKKITGIPAFTD